MERIRRGGTIVEAVAVSVASDTVLGDLSDMIMWVMAEAKVSRECLRQSENRKVSYPTIYLSYY